MSTSAFPAPEAIGLDNTEGDAMDEEELHFMNKYVIFVAATRAVAPSTYTLEAYCTTRDRLT